VEDKGEKQPRAREIVEWRNVVSAGTFPHGTECFHMMIAEYVKIIL
jgi:hypothetical protein